VMALFGNRVPCSSTKGATGHTLGAAGALEAVFCAIALTDAHLPGSPGTELLDPATPLQYLIQSRAEGIRYALSNSFGFGGSNCSLILGASA
jgi:3-oxoacyl-[acyl-carrier-protein] synthase-1